MQFDGYDLAQLKQRSRHDGGLDWDTAKIGTRTIRHNLRVVADKRLIESLSDAQQAAMWFIHRSYNIITSGMGCVTSDYSRVRGSSGNVYAGAEIIAEYLEWARKVVEKRLNHGMCMDIIAYGMSLRDVDFSRRQPRGRAKDNLIACLNLFVGLDGRPKYD